MVVRMGGVIKSSGPTPAIAKREWNNVRRVGGQEMAEEFHGVYLAKRFTRYGFSELNFAERTEATMKQKARDGHQNPLVASGVSKERALGPLRARTIAAADNFRVEITINAPALNFHNPKSKVYPAQEVRAVSSNEERKLTNVLDRGIDGALNKLNDNRTVTI